MKTVILVILLAASFGFFTRTIYRMVRSLTRGNPEPMPRFNRLFDRLVSVVVYFLFQRKVAQTDWRSWRNWSLHHLLIFWGFLLITVGTVEFLAKGVVPSFSYGLFLPDVLYHPLKAVIDSFNLIVLVVLVYAVFRRLVLKPSLIPMSLDAALIIGGIAALMVTHFLYHGFEIAHAATVSHQSVSSIEPGTPVSTFVAGWLMPVGADASHLAAQIAFWLHVVIVLSFLNYLPYSKHIHLIGALPNIFFRNLEEDQRLRMPKLDLEDENQWGVARFQQFTWKSLLDNYACTECARCTNNCPAYATDKNLSPMQLVHDIRYEMIDRDNLLAEKEALQQQAAPFADVDHGHGKPADLVYLEGKIAEVDAKLDEMPLMTGGRIAEDTLWACTTCGACQEVCPVFIEHPLKILEMRQNLVLEQEKVPGELGRTFRNIERQSNPWGISAEKRWDWMEGLEVPTLEDKPHPEYLLWVGCAGAFDNRIIKQTKALIKILNAAGVDYAVNTDEGCCGDPARRAGNEMLFQMQAEANIETLNNAGVKKILTSCPHGLHTLRHDYKQFGGDYEVIHHSQLIADLLAAGKIKPERAGGRKITYHDSCYLGRWNREFDAPRDIVDHMCGAGARVEMKRNKRYGFCCGAGGGRMFVDEEAPRVNTNRTDEVIETGAETVAVACPFCNIMLTDGMKERDKEDDIAVIDVAELVADGLQDRA